MEVSVMGSSQVNIGRTDLWNKEIGLCNFSKNLNFAKISTLKNCQSSSSCSLRCSSKSSVPFLLKASANVQTEAVVSGNRRSKPEESLKLYVGLPLDAVSESHSINHARAIAAGLKALKLLGVDGVELPIWWGIVEKEGMGKYNWTGYLALAQLVQNMGLKLHVSICFHGCNQCKIPLPEWVSQIGESEPNIFFSDRSGQRYKDCLSLSVDDLPVLNGKTPIQVYKDFCEDFKTSFSTFLGSTITGISIGLGPDGEIRYPSFHETAKNGHHHSGAGEFQCYDENMLSNLKKHAEAHGNPLWGLSGPHDSPRYEEMPISNGFFKEHGGSWETEYGDFFLSWYSNQLISHGDRLLSLAVSTFSDVPVTVSGKLPLMSSWYRTRSHPAELMAGFYNTVNRDGYKPIIEMFSKNSCKIILPGMDLSDDNQPNEVVFSSPESLIEQISSSCNEHGVEISGQNSLVISSAPGEGFNLIKNVLQGKAVDLFTYQRMGADFFSPGHFRSFTNFVQDLSHPPQALDSDDMAATESLPGKAATESLPGKNLQMQSA